MGSSVLVTVAELRMEKIEWGISTFNPSHRWKCWCRWYTYCHPNSLYPPSTIISILPVYTSSSQLKRSPISTFHSWLCFSPTIQMGRSPYQCQKKHPHTHRYFDFTSRIPLAYKVSVLWTLYTMSNSLQWTDEESHVSRALRQNSYPIHLICKTALCTCQITTPDDTCTSAASCHEHSVLHPRCRCTRTHQKRLLTASASRSVPSTPKPKEHALKSKYKTMQTGANLVTIGRYYASHSGMHG